MFIFVYRNFEGGYFDVGEQLTSNIESCLRAETTGSGTGAVTTYTALNTQGELALSLCNKNEIHALIAPFSPTQSLDSLIPSGIDFSLRVQFNEGILNTYNYHKNATLLKHSNPCFFFFSSKILCHAINHSNTKASYQRCPLVRASLPSSSTIPNQDSPTTCQWNSSTPIYGKCRKNLQCRSGPFGSLL